MLDIMYDLPSHPEIQECIINEDVLLKEVAPLLLYRGQSQESASVVASPRNRGAYPQPPDWPSVVLKVFCKRLQSMFKLTRNKDDHLTSNSTFAIPLLPL